MNELVYNTGVASFIIQIFTVLIDTFALSLSVPPSLYNIKLLLWIEYIVNFIEGTFYVWMIYNFSKIKNITITRYYDWVISTPIMLFTYSMYLLHTRYVEENKDISLFTSIYYERYTLMTIIFLNWCMLFFGYMSELGKINVITSTFLGFIPFFIMFYILMLSFNNMV